MPFAEGRPNAPDLSSSLAVGAPLSTGPLAHAVSGRHRELLQRLVDAVVESFRGLGALQGIRPLGITGFVPHPVAETLAPVPQRGVRPRGPRSGSSITLDPPRSQSSSWGHTSAAASRPARAESTRLLFGSDAPERRASTHCAVVVTAAKFDCSSTINVVCTDWALT